MEKQKKSTNVKAVKGVPISLSAVKGLLETELYA